MVLIIIIVIRTNWDASILTEIMFVGREGYVDRVNQLTWECQIHVLLPLTFLYAAYLSMFLAFKVKNNLHVINNFPLRMCTLDISCSIYCKDLVYFTYTPHTYTRCLMRSKVSKRQYSTKQGVTPYLGPHGTHF